MGQCPKCGATIREGHTSCPECGSAVEEITPPPPDIAAPLPPDADEEASREATAAAAAAAAVAASVADGSSGDASGPPSTGSTGTTTPAMRSPDPGDLEPQRPATPTPSAARGAQRASAGMRRSPGGGGRPGSDGARARQSGSAWKALFAPAAAIVVTLITQWLITSAVPAEAYVYRLFRPAGSWVMSIVPGFISFLLFWTLADLLTKHLGGRTNERDLQRPPIKQLPAAVANEPTNVTLSRLMTLEPSVLARHAGQRMLWLIRHLDSASDEQRTHEVLRHQSDLDADTAASGYRTVKLFIWAMPILGFIGTVLGISLAVGGFSEFLTSTVNIDEIDRVTAELGEVASGLSFAFDTTLLGLLGGLIATVASSRVQEREERFLTNLDELALSIMANHAATSAPAPKAPAASAADAPAQELEALMRERLTELSRQMDAFSQAVNGALEGFLGRWAALPSAVDKVAGDMDALSQHLTAAAKGADELTSRTDMVVTGMTEASDRMATGLSASMGSVRETLDELGDNVEGLSLAFGRSVTGFSERIAQSEHEVQAGLRSLQEAIERSHREDGAMRQLAGTMESLERSLEELRDSQRQLAPFLSQLSGPLELRLVPSAVPVAGQPAPSTRPGGRAGGGDD